MQVCSLAMEPVDHSRNQLVLGMLHPKEGCNDLVTRGNEVVVEAALSQIPNVLGHADERVRRCGVKVLAALVNEGDPETTIKLTQWLETGEGIAARKVEILRSQLLMKFTV